MIRIPQPKHDSNEPPRSLETNAPQPASDVPRAVPATDASQSVPIRTGSPFAEGVVMNVVHSPQPSAAGHSLADYGPLRYTAVGALLSSLIVLAFAIPAIVWFPMGGLVLSALGVGLSLFGIQSGRVRDAMCLLVVHLGLFLYCVQASQG